MALARPDVSFELRNKNSATFYSPGTGNSSTQLYLFYGVSQAREMIPVDSAAGSINVERLYRKTVPQPQQQKAIKNNYQRALCALPGGGREPWKKLTVHCCPTAESL